MNNMKTIVSLIFVLFTLSCNRDSSDIDQPILTNKLYVLPYPIGKAYTCSQGFNTSYSHFGTFSYSVDFGMPVGTLVTAARSGHIVYIFESNSDNDQIAGHENV